MNDELEQATSWLEKVTGDPMADAVVGTARVISASAAGVKPRYQECVLALRLEAPGVAADATTTVVFSRTRWPQAGDILPARISRSHPADTFEIDWDRLPTRR